MRFKLLRFLFTVMLALFCVPASSNFAIFQIGGSTAVTASFSTLKIGGGGFVSGIDMQSDGTKLARDDTYGAYLYNSTSGLWQQLVTKQSMPSSDNGINTSSAVGAYEIAAAPSNTSHLYMFLNGFVFSSTNKGTSWTKASLTQDTSATQNNYGGRNAAVDPANDNVAFIGTPNHLYKTSDGSTWATDSGVAATTTTSQGSGIMVAFDPTSAVTGGKTQGIYACSYGHGVYHTTNGGTSWSLTSGTPTSCAFMIVDVNGIVWLVDESDGAGTGTGNLNKFSGGIWSVAKANGNTIHSVAVDPATPAHVFAATSNNGNLFVSTNTGGSFVGPTAISVTASDVPWLALAATDGQFTTAFIGFDPAGSNLLYNGNGIGLFKTNPPTTNTTVTWASQTAGIENLVSNAVVGIASGKPLVTNWDRPGFIITPGTYPSTYGGLSCTSSPFGLGSGWSGDVDPTGSLAAILSTPVPGGGSCGSSSSTAPSPVSWSIFGGSQTGASQNPALTNSTPGGCMAVSTTTHFLWIGDDNGSNTNKPWTTTNGGTSWTEQTVGSAPTTGPTGWGANYYQYNVFCAADKVTADTYYLYNSNGSTANGVWISTNGGSTWTHAYTGGFGGSISLFFQMKAVPGHAGNLFATSGNQGGTTDSGTSLYQSTNSGTTWNAIGHSVGETWCVGFGAIASGQSYPTVYFIGYVGGVFGAYKSIDNFASAPVKTGDGFPGGTLMPAKDCYGDMGMAGTMYITTNGNGSYIGTNL
jgi:hypothetical protein